MALFFGASIIRRQTGLVLAAAACLVGGCDYIGEIAAVVETDAAAIEESIADARSAAAGDGPPLRTLRLESRRPFTGFRRAVEDPRSGLPTRLLLPDAVTVPLAGAATPAALAARIEAAAGLPVRLVGPPPKPVEGAVATPAFGGGAGDALRPAADIWTGSLPELLEAWTESLGWEWQYDRAGERIEVIRSRTSVFRLHALVGRQIHSSRAASSGSLGAEEARGSVSQSITSETEYDPWAVIADQLATLVSSQTALSVAPEAATVTVSGLPADVTRVRAYLAYVNEEVLRPVTLTVEVYAVQRSRGGGLTVDIVGALRRIFGTTYDVVVGGAVDGLGVPVQLIAPGTAGAPSTLAATVAALREVGTATRVVSATVPSLNGQVAQFADLYSQSYVSEVETSVESGVIQTSISADELASGFSFSYVPRITAPDEVLVRLFALLQDRPEITEFRAAGIAVQLPSYGSRSLSLTQRLGRGETALITGFGDREATADRSGTFDETVPLPGGAQRSRIDRSDLVLLVTAEIGAPLGISEVPGASL